MATAPSSSDKRIALDVLTADRLRQVVHALDLTLHDYRSRSSLISGLADGRRIAFDAVLERLSRDELKAMCHALDLETSGREKRLLIDRLLAGSGQVSSTRRTSSPPDLGVGTKRAALDALTAARLRALLDRLDLEVDDRRSRDALLGALVDDRVNLADVLLLLKRFELQAACRALGLDSGGRKKSGLIGRILDAQGATTGATAGGTAVPGKSPRPTRSNMSTPTQAPPPAGPAPPDPRGKLTREQLEGYLWAAADILRGSIDSSDYKNFIFGLLFLKRLSDRFEEECEELVREGADPEDPDEHQFFVPKRARWSELQKAATGLGEVLNKASAALEEHNPTLEGVLAGIDYNDERKLGDARQRDNILHQLVQHFAGLVLRNDHLSEPDMLGRAYEYLIEKFADDAGKKGGEFYTPNMVVKLIVELLEPQEGMRICDPTCGSGGMLIQCAQYIREHAKTAGGRAAPANFTSLRPGEETWAPGRSAR